MASVEYNGADRAANAEDPATIDQLVSTYRPLALALARRVHRGGTSLEELNQVACEGLLAAIGRFDPTRGVPFGAFATPTILGQIKRHYRDSGWGMRVPRQTHELAGPIARATDELTQQLGRTPSPVELAGALGIDVDQVRDVQQATAARATLSLDAPASSTGQNIGSAAGDNLARIEAGFARTENHLDLIEALRTLPSRDREILEQYFVHELSQAAIAERYGVSQMQVSRWISAATARLRRHFLPPAN